MADHLLLETDPRGVVTLWLNRPEIHNAFDDTLIADLTTMLRAVEADAAVRVVVLAGKGKSFSAGADLNWMKRTATYSEAENLRDAEGLATLMRTLDRLAKPTVAAVHGAAFAGGVGLIACCDIALAAETAVFGVSEVRVGVIPSVISPYVIAAIGARAARRLFLTGERFPAHEAHRLGLVHEVYKPADFETGLRQTTDHLLEAAPLAQAAAKRMIRRVAHGAIDEAMVKDTVAGIAGARASAEGREGLAAFLEKRKPVWPR
jgi:methylglutaconyl-CoA hydratase